ncbi:unnamed protein product [Brassica oleracea var. botrytis]|nr:unnamed protein product [Brassica napus]CDY31780.1 BnaC01g27360D [Brassica napus]VDD51108.1 unnamed protein product [Brassica oleracea]
MVKSRWSKHKIKNSKKLKGKTPPTLPEEEERDTYLVAANDKLNPDPVEEEEDVNLAEEQDGDANCVEEKEEDVSSGEEEEDANYEKNSVEEEGEIGSEERSSHETWVVDDIQSHEEQRDKDEGRSSRTLSNCGDTSFSSSTSFS